MLNIVRIFVQKTSKRTEEEVRSFLKRTMKSEKKMMYEKFNKFIKKIRITIHNTSTLSLSMKHKIVIYLFEKYITKNEKQ